MFTRDFLYLLVSALQFVLTAMATPILTRRLSADQFGQLALCATVMQILGPIFGFGLPFASQKIFAGEDGDRRARGILAISAVLAIAAWLVVALAAPAWGPAVGLYRVLDARLAALWGAFLAVTWTCLAMLRSSERLGMAVFVAALQSLGAQAVGLTLLWSWAPTITSYLCGMIIGQGAAALVGLLALRPAWSALAATRRYGRAFLFGLPMVPQQLSGFILFAGDRIVVRHDLGSAATGRYSVAYNVGALGVTLLVFVNQAWMPRIYAVADRGVRSRLLASSRDMMNLLLIPVICGLSAAAPVVLGVWAPPSFHPASLTLIVAIVAIYTFPYGQFLSNLRALMSEGRTGRAAVTTLVAAVVNVGLNIVMVPFIGITGSAIATVLSYLLLARLTRQPASSGLQVPGTPLLLGTLIGCAVAVTLSMAALPASHMWLAMRLAVCVVAALALVLLMRRAMSGSELPRQLVIPVADVGRHRRGHHAPGTDPTPLIRKYDATMAEPDDIAVVDALPPARPIRAGGVLRARWAVALALTLATLAVAGVVIFHSGLFHFGLDSRPAAAAKSPATPSVLGRRRTGASAPSDPAPTSAAAPAHVLVPVNASAFGSGGLGSGDNPQIANMAIDANTTTAWTTNWYRTAQFGGLHTGTGLLIDMGHRIGITRVWIVLGSERGADLQLLTGNVPALAKQRLQASASDAGGVVRLKLARPEPARYLLIWFTLLPPASPGTFAPAGTFQASVYNVRIYAGHDSAAPQGPGHHRAR
jgi:O-antigen/teichoic acid export membrane protein